MFKQLLARFGYVEKSQMKMIEGTLSEMRLEIMSLRNGRIIYPEGQVQRNAIKYTTSDDLYSIVRLIAQTSALIPMQSYQVKDEKQRGNLKKHISNTVSKKLLMKKSLTELPETDPLNILLERPNKKMGKFEFYEAIHSMLPIHGEVILLKERVALGVNGGKTRQLHILYPQHVVLRVTNSYPNKVLAYDYIVNGVKIIEDIPPEEIIHIKYFNPVFGIDGTELRGLSPFKVLLKRIKRSETNLDTSNSQLDNGGVPGIVFDKLRPADWKAGPEFTGKRRENFYKYLVNKENKGAPYFADGELDYKALGLSLVDMDSIELEKIDFKKFCNAFGVPDILFNNNEASTDNNTGWATKRLYTNTCLPNVYRVRDALNVSITAEYKNEGKFIDCDITEINELQEDSQKMATWLAAAWWINPNDKRETMNWERDPNPLMDVVYMPANMVPITEVGLQPLQITPDYQNNPDANV